MTPKFSMSLADLHPRYNPADQRFMDELLAISKRVNATSQHLRLHIGEIQPDAHTPVGFIHHYDDNESLIHREDWPTVMRVLKSWFP